MAKTKVVWSCSECGQSQFKWSGQCPQCENWNTMMQEVDVLTRRFEAQDKQVKRPIRLKEVDTTKTPRIASGIMEFDRLLGGGVVPGGT